MQKCWINLIWLAASSVLIASLKLRYPKLLQKDYLHCLMHVFMSFSWHSVILSFEYSRIWSIYEEVSRSYVSSTLKEEWKNQLRKSSIDRDRAERLRHFINFPICPVLLFNFDVGLSSEWNDPNHRNTGYAKKPWKLKHDSSFGASR